MNEKIKELESTNLLNISEGLANCGFDEDFYIEIVSDFINALPIDELNKILSERDIYLYQVTVHKLKSSSKIIGAGELSASALHMEELAKSKDLDALLSSHNDFINKCTNFKNIIEGIIK